MDFRKPFKSQQKSSGTPLKLIPLGGSGNITKNMFVYEYKDDIVIVDCGVSFPDEEMMGVDLVIPNISYLRDKIHKIRAIIITHAHDDHYGGLPFLWNELKAPIYSQKLTVGFIKNKFREQNLPMDQIKVVDLSTKLKFGNFDVSFYGVSHSVPDSTGIVLKTPVGTLIHQADFKIDWTPVNGQKTDVGEVARLGNEGVVLLSMDSLRSEKAGYTQSEMMIESTFEAIEKDCKGKLLITVITSNITRIQQALNVALKSGRKVAVVGRSMVNNFQVARDLGYLNIPPNLIIAPDEIKRFADEKLMIIIAGSLGQPGSALSRAAHGDHKFISIKKSDTVVFSADPMPSAEVSQASLINEIAKIGCSVYASNTTPELHVSGHAAAEEIKLMIELARPKYLMPMGGEYRHMRTFAKLAKGLGYKENQILIPGEGEYLEIYPDRVNVAGKVDTTNVYVDGLGVGDVGDIILRDRQQMSAEGIVLVMVPIDRTSGKVIKEPDIISRGFIFGEGWEDVIEAGKEITKSALKDTLTIPIDHRYVRHEIQKSLEKFFYEETGRRPLILTNIVEV